MSREVLVAVAHGAGSGGVFRDEDGVWLSGVLDDRGGTLIDGRVSFEGTEGGWVVGGLLPAGAVSAVVIGASGEPVEATCAGWAWAAVVELGPIPEPAVRFEDAGGTVIRPLLPESWARQPIDDAREPCPACGATSWEHVTPDDDSHGAQRRDDGPWEPSPVIVRTRCGHEEGAGVWYAGEGDEGVPESELPERPRMPESAPLLNARERERRAAVARAERFTVELPAGDVTATFEGVRSGTAWAAAGTVGELRVAIAARDVPVERVRLGQREL